MLVFSLVCLLVASKAQSLWRSVFIDLAASSVAVIPTVLFINLLLERNKKLRWQLANKTTLASLQELRDVHLRYIVMSWGYMPGAGKDDQYTATLSQERRNKYLKVIKAKLIEHDPSDVTNGFSKSEWQALANLLQRLIDTIPSTIQTYRESISPELLGLLLQLEGALKTLHFIFNLDSRAFLESWSAWEKLFASQKYANMARQNLQKRVSEAFFAYLKAFQALSLELEQVS